MLEYSNGKHELDSMDDELPIIIYIATQIKVANMFAELNIVDDYFRIISRDDLMQNKMITNLLSSLIYITKNWNSELCDFNENVLFEEEPESFLIFSFFKDVLLLLFVFVLFFFIG